MSNHVVVTHTDGSSHKIAPLGNWLYVRHCIAPQSRGGIIIPEKSRDMQSWVEVLAVGPNVGRRVSERFSTERVQKTLTPHVVADGINSGTLLLCRRNHPELMKESPYDRQEYFVFCDPEVILAIWNGDPTPYSEN